MQENIGLIVLEHTIDDSPHQETAGAGSCIVGEIHSFSESCASSEGGHALDINVIAEGTAFKLPDYVGSPEAKYVEAISDHQPIIATRLETACIDAANTGARVFSVGGNHTRAVELVGYLRACQVMGKEPIVVWYDGHLDCHTPATSESKHVHGMVAALLFGEGDHALTKLWLIVESSG
jgi:arginase family enzyme